jgi:hypothetical protein
MHHPIRSNVLTGVHSLKPFWPLILTFVLPRALGYARALRVAYRTRPLPQPLSKKASLALNILFVTICIFFFASFSSIATDQVNIFILTNSRLAMPTEPLFSRLASVRPGQILTPSDELLREKLTSTAVRKLYLRFGPSTILECPFCTPLDSSTYLLYHFPKNIVLPHLFNFGILGLATSATVAGFEASSWRLFILLGALMIAGIDAYAVVRYQPALDVNMPAPSGLFWVMAVMRPLSLCFYDSIVAFVIYASATNRFLLFGGPSKTPESIRRQTLDFINKSGFALTSAATKMRATNLAHNTVVRDHELKSKDSGYWQEVASLEGTLEASSGVWEDDNVQAAVAQAYSSGTVDVERIKREADAFVKGVTQNLDSSEQ